MPEIIEYQKDYARFSVEEGIFLQCRTCPLFGRGGCIGPGLTGKVAMIDFTRKVVVNGIKNNDFDTYCGIFGEIRERRKRNILEENKKNST